MGGFAHDTGEGGLTPYHLAGGGDLVGEIGSGYFVTRTGDGDFDPDQFADLTAHFQVIPERAGCVNPASLPVSASVRAASHERPGVQDAASAAQRERTVLTPGVPIRRRLWSEPRELVRTRLRWGWSVSNVMRMGWDRPGFLGCRSSLRPGLRAWSGALAIRGVNQIGVFLA